VVAAPAVVAKITLQQSAGSVNLGQSVTYALTVRRSHASDPAPTGAVQLIDAQGNPLSDVVDLVNGDATIVLPWTFAGPKLVLPIYSGDANYGLTYGNSVLTNVNPGHTSMSLASSAANVSSQSQTSFVALVTDRVTNPNVQTPGAENGLVEFWDSLDGHAPQLLQTRPLTVGNGNTSTTVLPTTLPVGHNQITAKFLGTPDWTPAVSNTVVVNVNSSPVGN
jgi:hypothetical protein